MLFNSSEFVFVFLPLVLLGFYLLEKFGAKNYRLGWLSLASLFFYGWWEPKFLILIVVSILSNFFISTNIYSSTSGKRRVWLWTGLILNLGLLGYFKYINFAIENLNSFFKSGFVAHQLILPLAISFFTFQQIAYLVDVFKEKASPGKFSEYFLFVSFFPQLIAGPIVHHQEIIPQFKKNLLLNFSQRNLGMGLAIFFIGLAKKVIIADQMAIYANPIFLSAEEGQALTFFEAWVGVLAFTFQIYFDFSGYSDMAIGIAKMFNIDLPLNFNAPYKASSIIDFWKRWHITLSRFLKNYLYIPLGGNRKGPFRKYVNLMITMLLGGLWHGAGWTFVIWGLLHGFYLIVNHGWRRVAGTTETGILSKKFFLPFYTALTFLCVSVGWVFFRAETFSGAKNVLMGMIGVNGVALPELDVMRIFPFLREIFDVRLVMNLLGGGSTTGFFTMLMMLLLAFSILWFPARHKMGKKVVYFALVLSFAFSIQTLVVDKKNIEFIYFQF